MIYLDNAATTHPEFFRADYEKEVNFFNSNMNYATVAQTNLLQAESMIKKCLNVSDDNGCILWFRCATDAFEWLVRKTKLKFYCHKYEHDSVYDLCTPISNDLDINKNICPLSVQYVNQMTGVINDLNRFQNWRFLFSDFTATVGHTAIPSNLEMLCDAVWFSGHKFHTEKGMGALWISNKLFKTLNGVDNIKNQYGLIHGTVDVAGAMMLANAMQDAVTNLFINTELWGILSDILVHDLRANNIDCHYIADNYNRTNAINALYLDGISSDALQIYLATQDIYVGVGHSACADNADYRVLEAYGLTPDAASHVIRISFNKENTIHEIKALVAKIIEFKNLF